MMMMVATRTESEGKREKMLPASVLVLVPALLLVLWGGLKLAVGVLFRQEQQV